MCAEQVHPVKSEKQKWEKTFFIGNMQNTVLVSGGKQAYIHTRSKQKEEGKKEMCKRK